jgi:hypothetical protein
MKKALIITYYWPPAGGSGVQRVTKFCKYLNQFGWEPIVLTVDGGEFGNIDSSLVKDVQHIRSIYRAPSWEPHSIYRRLMGGSRNRARNDIKYGHSNNTKKYLRLLGEYIRLNLFIPDSRIGWLHGAVKKGLKAIEEHQPEIIFSTAPPYTSHLIGLKLKKKTGLPWITDFRDPWLENHAYNTVPRLNIVKYINKRLEHKVLKSSDRIICVGNQMRKLLSSKLPPLEMDKCFVITNGYDNRDVKNINYIPQKFYISHFGPMYFRRFPLNLFLTIKEIIENDANFKRDCKLRFCGGSEPAVQQHLHNMFEERNLSINDYLQHDEILDLIFQPQLLILTIDKVPLNELIITGKVFEYITTGNPILGVGPTKGDAAHILHESTTGQMIDYNDTHSMHNFIRNAFESWKEETLNKGLNYFEVYERRHLTKQLAALFDNCME